ncbi:hypothetical protein B0H16DRAFT_1458725 [Mycena metata]|uniref:Uncharacterized protein n=1 Tax=Mycena metata TaxID=1033252 RepID=A0AAD7J214_9AGAR|nr:hypothetical protein B0H16DRAFT_1458725 [Mycena metata]
MVHLKVDGGERERNATPRDRCEIMIWPVLMQDQGSPSSKLSLFQQQDYSQIGRIKRRREYKVFNHNLDGVIAEIVKTQGNANLDLRKKTACRSLTRALLSLQLDWEESIAECKNLSPACRENPLWDLGGAEFSNQQAAAADGRISPDHRSVD